MSLFYNKIYKTENTESSIILNKIRSLLGGSSEHSFREHRPCYIHGRTHVGISDVAKCGKGILAHKPNNIILFTVTILTQLSQLGLNLEHTRGQGYDGASNMSGKYRGVQARVKELYPLAMYTHCCNHVLNLVFIIISNNWQLHPSWSSINDKLSGA